MTEAARRIGIFGGTFDPVHFGHLQAALEAQERLDLDELRFMPAGEPPHKAEQLFSASERLQALEIATQNVPLFSVDDRELRREGPSYSLLSLQELRAENPDACLYFVIGTDAWNGFTSWHRYEEILELCHLLIVTRPGVALFREGDHQALLGEHLATDAVQLSRQSAGYILPLSVSRLEISSTAIRDRLLARQPVEYLLPQAVATFLQKIRYGE